MADGIGCTCSAWSENECCCGVDWTPKELIELRERCTENVGVTRHADDATLAYIAQLERENAALKEELTVLRAKCPREDAIEQARRIV